jgi:hypothetical protein
MVSQALSQETVKEGKLILLPDSDRSLLLAYFGDIAPHSCYLQLLSPQLPSSV